MNITQEQVLNALRTVDDPDLKRDLVTLNMIKNLQIEGNTIRFVVELTTPACPLKEMIRQACETAIHEQVSPEAELEITMSSNVTTTRLQNTPMLPDVKNIIAVASGKGGVGKSTVAANLAVTLSQMGARVGLVDADIFGPSIPTMFNVEFERPNVKQVDGKNIIIPLEQYGVKLISIGFLMSADEAIVWRGPMASKALQQFLSDVEWGALDYLIIDLPPGTSDIHLTLVQSVPVTGSLIVTTPQKVALADARKALAMFRQPQINVPILGIVENMAYFTPAELPDSRYYIFGQAGGKALAEKTEVPFLGEIPLVQSIRESGDKGYPAALSPEEGSVERAAFEAMAQEFARQVAIRNDLRAKTKPVEMKTFN
ncbi:MAG: Mrp/NBP35 family ATP-binding protein [Cyclobacteriaceae bacterium]